MLIKASADGHCRDGSLEWTGSPVSTKEVGARDFRSARHQDLGVDMRVEKGGHDLSQSILLRSFQADLLGPFAWDNQPLTHSYVF